MTSGACVSNPAQRSPIIMCLEGRHGLHRQPVLDQHPEGCALAARARRHVDDMTISNRVRLAAHHDDFVHLTPVHLPEETMEALVVGERRVARCSCCMRGSLDRTWLAVDRGDKTRNWNTESPFLTLNPERFTVKKERFTSPAIRHCFLSGFDHRGASTRYSPQSQCEKSKTYTTVIGQSGLDMGQFNGFGLRLWCSLVYFLQTLKPYNKLSSLSPIPNIYT